MDVFQIEEEAVVCQNHNSFVCQRLWCETETAENAQKLKPLERSLLDKVPQSYVNIKLKQTVL
jgi:hypothetical protein